MQEKTIDVEIRCLSRKILRELFSTFRHREIESQIGTNGWILAYIDKNSDRDVFQKDLEKEFGVSRSAASKNVDFLIKNGFIRRESVDYDARLKKLVLNEKSYKVIDLMKENGKNLENRLIKGFTDDELKTFRNLLLKMSDNLDCETEESEKND